MSKVISVDNISKAYRLGMIGGGTLKEDVSRWWAKALGRPDPLLKIGETDHARQVGEQFWALNNVSFDVKEGEVLGIIGRNGAGKSTLLKILSQVTAPTSGEIKIRGRIASLLEVGTGFHPELTGRENIFLNGAILGMTKAEIRRKLTEIIDFSEIEQFIDTPVKRYSSGMYVRLAFAVAAHLEPEILIVDEVLAVGDTAFQQKCLGKMKDVSRTGRTVLFISHNMTAIASLCSSAIMLSDGKLVNQGSVSSCVETYLSNNKTSGPNWNRTTPPASRKSLYFSSAKLGIEGTQPHLTLELDLETESLIAHKAAFVAVDILDATGTSIMQAIPTLAGFLNGAPRRAAFHVRIDLPPLVPGHYSVSFWAGPHNTETYDEVVSVVSFEITESPTTGRSFPHYRENGAIVPHSTVETRHGELSRKV